MRSLITQAIQEHRLLRLSYQYQVKTIEPYILGLTKDHREAVLCRQISPPAAGGGQQWQLLYLDWIANLRLLNTHAAPAPGLIPPAADFAETYAALRA